MQLTPRMAGQCVYFFLLAIYRWTGFWIKAFQLNSQGQGRILWGKLSCMIIITKVAKETDLAQKSQNWLFPFTMAQTRALASNQSEDPNVLLLRWNHWWSLVMVLVRIREVAVPPCGLSPAPLVAFTIYGIVQQAEICRARRQQHRRRVNCLKCVNHFATWKWSAMWEACGTHVFSMALINWLLFLCLIKTEDLQ